MFIDESFIDCIKTLTEDFSLSKNEKNRQEALDFAEKEAKKFFESRKKIKLLPMSLYQCK